MVFGNGYVCSTLPFAQDVTGFVAVAFKRFLNTGIVAITVTALLFIAISSLL
jgi:hypothetical protein